MTICSQNGIPLEDAISILTLRKPHQHTDCNCIGEGGKRMGQKIDLFGTVPQEQEQGEMEIEKSRIDREERHKKVQNELNEMSEKELLHVVLKVQEDRVKAYRDYET